MMKLHVVVLLALAGYAFGYNQPNCDPGRTVIVHLFNWKWTDIAAECERFLGPKGFCGVQVSPPNEHYIGPGRPWWERYQPVSYKLTSRSGNDQQFRDMVSRCKNVGVKIYVDAVINHMTGSGASGTGTAGSGFDANRLSFSGVPYGPNDFNCCHCSMCSSGSCDIGNYNNVNEVRNCRLVSLVDLALGNEYVRDKVAGFLNELMDIGVAGLRVDACKHMWPGDIQAIYNKLNSKPFIFNEVIDLGGEAIGAGEYTHLGRVTEFKFSANIGSVFRGWNGQVLSNLRNWGEGWGFLASDKALVFVDNHDNQRGHGAGGASVLTFWEPALYKKATAFKLAHPYGFVRIMSSHTYENTDQGPPAWGDNINDVPINGDGTCDGGWICEHRWRQITNMVKFRNVADGHGLNNWWENGGNQIAFSRGDRAFIAFNNEGYGMDVTLTTGLAEGTYCDVISGDLVGDSCTGSSVYVDGSSRARIQIGTGDDSMVAFHAESRVGSGGGGNPGTPGPTTTQGPPPEGYQRTIVFLKLQTSPGQDVFLRGGIDHTVRPGCFDDASSSPCAVSIQHNDIGSGSHYAKYNAWKVGDKHLDWYGPESGQGSYNGQQASGSPSAWTSNSQSSPGYQQTNNYGDHYWMMDVNMNCDETENGWFELKGYATNYPENNGWEFNIGQDQTCKGSAGGSRPYQSSNHMARCGHINVFEWNSGGCTIDHL